MLNTTTFQQDLDDAQEFLSQLQKKVALLEGSLAGGREVKFGEQTIRDLNETRLRFGNPIANLTRLTPKRFDDFGIELTSQRKDQMRNQFDFYYMTLALNAQLKSGINLSSVKCRLDLGPKNDPNEPMIETYFPKRIWKEVLQFGGEMRLGLDGNLDFNAGLDLETLPQEIRDNIPVEIKAKIEAQNKINSFIIVPNFRFNLGRADISTSGEQSSTCFWDLQNPELQETQSLEFMLLFKVPKGQRKIGMVGRAQASVKISWLSAKIDHVLDHLSDELKAVFEQREKVPLGVEEVWREIELPD